VGPISLSGIKDGSDTRVIIADKQILNPAPGSLAFHNSATGYSTFSESAVSIIVDRGLSAQFYSDRVLAQDLTIINNEIRAEQDVDVYINTSGTGKLRTNFAMRFDNVVSSDPMHENNTTIVYSKNISTGNTGLYFVSNNTTVGTVTDELISKNRALVYSMLF
jgi:predicted DNA binding protein